MQCIGQLNIEMEYSKSESQKVVAQPELQRLLDSLRKETDLSQALTSKVTYLGNLLRQIESSVNIAQDDNGPSKEPEGIMDHLWVQIEALKSSNAKLAVAANHLESIIGN